MILPAWAPRFFVDQELPWPLDRVAAAFLRECRTHRVPLQQLASVRVAVRRGPFARAALALRDHLKGLATNTADLECLCRAADRACSEVTIDVADASSRHDAALRCRVAAELLDAVAGSRILTCLMNRLNAGTAIAPGDPYPRIQPPLRELFTGRLTTHPHRQDEFPIDHLPWIAIADDGPVELRFDFSLSQILPMPVLGTRLAAIFPISGVASDDANPPDHDAVLVRIPIGDPHRFVVEPVSARQNEAALVRLLAAADDDGCLIAIAPELCVGDSAVVAARHWLVNSSRSLELVVCGSAHHVDAGRRYNRSTALIRERNGHRVKTFSHDKFNRFGYLHRGEMVYEAIDETTANVTSWVHVGTAAADPVSRALWSYATLICKDMFREGVDMALQHARVGLLLVPAMSERLVTFEQIATGIARTQTVTVVANHDPGESGLLVARPIEGVGVQRWPRPPSGIQVIVLCE